MEHVVLWHCLHWTCCVVICTCVQNRPCSSISIVRTWRDDTTISPNKLSRIETNPEYDVIRVLTQCGLPTHCVMRGALRMFWSSRLNASFSTQTFPRSCLSNSFSSRQRVHWSCMPSEDSNTMNWAWSSTASHGLHQTTFWCTGMYLWHGPCAHCIRISDLPESGLSLGESLNRMNWVRLYTNWCKDSSTALVVSEMSRGFPWTAARLLCLPRFLWRG